MNAGVTDCSASSRNAGGQTDTGNGLPAQIRQRPIERDPFRIRWCRGVWVGRDPGRGSARRSSRPVVQGADPQPRYWNPSRLRAVPCPRRFRDTTTSHRRHRYRTRVQAYRHWYRFGRNTPPANRDHRPRLQRTAEHQARAAPAVRPPVFVREEDCRLSFVRLWPLLASRQ